MTDNMPIKNLVIPCSGTGKALASVSRETCWYALFYASARFETICLSLIMLGDEEALKRIRGNSCITLDGCHHQCAKTIVEQAGGKIIKAYRVTEFLKEHKDWKPKTILHIGAGGQKLCQLIARELVEKIK